MAEPFTLQRVSVWMIDCMVTKVVKISAFTSQGCSTFCDWVFRNNSGKLEEAKPLRKEKKVLYNFEIPEITGQKQNNIHGPCLSKFLGHKHKSLPNVYLVSPSNSTI